MSALPAAATARERAAPPPAPGAPDRAASAIRRGILYAFVAVIVWGASFAATKQALAELGPWTIVFTRTALGASFICGLAAVRGRIAVPARGEWRTIVLLALAGLVLTQVLQAYALRVTTSAATAWIVALNPIVTAILAALFLGEALGRRLPGITVAFAGALLVVSHGTGLARIVALPSTRGDALNVASTLTWGWYTIAGRAFATRRPPAETMPFLLAAAAAMVVAPFLATAGWRELAGLSASGWACLVYLGVGCTGVAFTLYALALETLPAADAAALIYFEPLVAQAISAALLGEPLHATTVVGGVAILAGVWLVARATPARPASSS